VKLYVFDDNFTLLPMASTHEAPATAKLFENSHKEMDADAFKSRNEPPSMEAARPANSLAKNTFVQFCECIPIMATAAPEDATA